MTWTGLAVIAYLMDTYVPGMAGFRWWFVVGSMIYGVIRIIPGLIQLRMLPDTRTDTSGFGWLVILFTVGAMIINVFVLNFLAPELLVWILVYTGIITVPIIYMAVRKM